MSQPHPRHPSSFRLNTHDDCILVQKSHASTFPPYFLPPSPRSYSSSRSPRLAVACFPPPTYFSLHFPPHSWKSGRAPSFLTHISGVVYALACFCEIRRFILTELLAAHHYHPSRLFLLQAPLQHRALFSGNVPPSLPSSIVHTLFSTMSNGERMSSTC